MFAENYETRNGVALQASGRRLVVAVLREECPVLGLGAGAWLGVDVDAPLAAGDRALVEYRGGVFVREVHRVDVSLCFCLDGQEWPVRRASWGRKEEPVVVGLVSAAGWAL